MGRRRVVVAAAVVALAAAFAPAAASPVDAPAVARAAAWPGDAPYSVPLHELDSALACRDGIRSLDGSGRAQPVLLVHGTGLTRVESWRWTYWRALRRAGFEVCWVQLPQRALRDAQVSAEYVARAVQVMSSAARERVDVLGHSQGGIVARWAVRYFASGARVDDLVGLAAPNHGTVTADALAAPGRCFESCWQMRTTARFSRALNAGDETPGDVSYTSVYTRTDELVQPWTSPPLRGASNVALQDVCPGRPTGHMTILGDAVAWRLVVDALTSAGGAAPARVGARACLRTTMQGMRPGPLPAPSFDDAPVTDREPPLRRYARR